MRSVDLKIDVTGTADLPGRLEVAVTVHLPDRADSLPVMLIALPGGGYNRRYFDLRIGGYPDHSQARFHTDRGWGLTACDPIGVGESSTPPQPHTVFEVAAVQAAVVAVLRHRLAEWSLVEGLPAHPETTVVGVGHSMGGCFTVAAQGSHASYDAIAVLGYSAVHTELPLPSGGFATVPGVDDHSPEMQLAVATALMESFRWVFHYDDVPADIVARDMASVPLRAGSDVPDWGLHAASLPCGVDMLTPGVVAAAAADIRCPVLVAQGERDVVRSPAGEPDAYPAAAGVTVRTIATMAHLHNFASTRQVLWQELQDWGAGLG